ncbi:type I pantothenate kinase [Tistrella sp. BH-R2-4]|uniref:Pantothenate kinase n=2 Tax=Geminicoccaceae TaxID=2066434 RepID=A0ABU9YGG1_9PROT
MSDEDSKPGGARAADGHVAPAEWPGYMTFDRPGWAALRANTPMTLAEDDLAALRGLQDPIGIADVEEVFLPLSRLLNLHVAAARQLGQVKDAFLGRPVKRPPYVIAVVGSVAVGKSTFARVLRALLARWPDHPRVDLVTTDGFLYPTRVLKERGLMTRKGFPESYDTAAMIRFLAAVKAGEPMVEAPVYSHLSYDIVPDAGQSVRQPDILILEGLNLLQVNPTSSVVVSDFCDISMYLDADEADVAAWYVQRFLLLQKTAFQNPSSYFHHYRDLSHDAAVETARGIWQTINRVNLHDNILPTRKRADLVLRKAADHTISEVRLRMT